MQYRWLACAATAACGRLGFDAARVGADAAPDANADAQHVPIAYVQPFIARHPGAGANDTFTIQALAADDMIVFQASCSDTTMNPASIAVSAPGWTWLALDPITGDPATMLWSATFAARAPDTTPATMTVAWASTACNVGKGELADELAGVASVGLASTVHGTNDCTGTINTEGANEAVWGACFTATALVAVGPGYTKGADDGGGDWAEYKITTDPASTVETVSFTNAAVGYVLSMITLRPAAP
jgi:hypothetical protein